MRNDSTGMMQEYRVNEIFYSLQGEGFWTGVPSVFVRFSGCNLSCRFCDTQHESYESLHAEEILQRVKAYGCRRVVLTGGEPTMQLDRTFVDLFKSESFYLQIETNGSVRCEPYVEDALDWITCSPKQSDILPGRVDEIKILYLPNRDAGWYERWERYAGKMGAVLMLQPCDVGDMEENKKILSEAVDFVLSHPQWRLSLQTHKMLQIK